MSTEATHPHRLGFVKKPSLGVHLYHWVLGTQGGRVTESLPFPSLDQAVSNAVDVFKADLLDENRIVIASGIRTRDLLLSEARKRYEKVGK